jgi:hypothetical protein
MGRVRAASLVLAALAVGLLLAACGGGGAQLLPGPTADQITTQLDQVRQTNDEGNCESAEDGVAKVSTEVDELGKVDVKLKKAMRQAAAKLSEVVGTCRAQEEKEQAAEEAKAEEQEEAEAEELAEEEAFEEEQKTQEREEDEENEEREEKAQEKAEEHAEQPGPPEEGEESNGKAKGHEKQEEVEPPVEGEEEVIPPGPQGGGPAGGVGPGAAVEGGGG